eukprot:m.61676 g.61676  ORF g.61676 m.61676 type:complete len:218 (+) comp13736_c1_seq1:190-843(+)
MADLVASYEKDFAILIADITRRTTTIPDLDGETKKNEIKNANRDIQEAKELLEQMEIDVADVPGAQRATVRANVQKYRNTLADAEKALRKASIAQSSSADARDELFAYEGSSSDQREALISNTDRLDRAGNRLKEGSRMARETEEIAIGIMDNLNTQRETIQRSRGRLGKADDGLTKSNRILNSIIVRAKQNKVVAFLIIFIAIGLIILIAALILTR